MGRFSFLEDIAPALGPVGWAYSGYSKTKKSLKYLSEQNKKKKKDEDKEEVSFKKVGGISTEPVKRRFSFLDYAKEAGTRSLEGTEMRGTSALDMLSSLGRNTADLSTALGKGKIPLTPQWASDQAMKLMLPKDISEKTIAQRNAGFDKMNELVGVGDEAIRGWTKKQEDRVQQSRDTRPVSSDIEQGVRNLGVSKLLGVKGTAGPERAVDKTVATIALMMAGGAEGGGSMPELATGSKAVNLIGNKMIANTVPDVIAGQALYGAQGEREQGMSRGQTAAMDVGFGALQTGVGTAWDVAKAGKLINAMENADYTGNLSKWAPEEVTQEAKQMLKNSMGIPEVKQTIYERVGKGATQQRVYDMIDSFSGKRLRNAINDVNKIVKNVYPEQAPMGAIADNAPRVGREVVEEVPTGKVDVTETKPDFTEPSGPIYDTVPKEALEEAPAETAGEPLEKLQSAIRTAKTELGKKIKETSAERARRFAQIEKVTTPGQAGLAAKKKILSGTLSERKLGNVLSDSMTSKDVDDLINLADTNPALTGIEKVAVGDAMEKFIKEGQIPGQKMLNMFENVYGSEFVSTLKKSLTPEQKAMENVLDIVNIPRTVMASFDMSAPFRQGIVLMARHPIKSLKAGKEMVKAFASEDAYQQVAKSIMENPNYSTARNAGIEFTEYGKGVLNNREESFISQMAEKIPIVRNSERAYTAYLNKMRMDVFSDLADKYEKLGYDTIKDAKIFEDVAGFINRATGRGDINDLTFGLNKATNGRINLEPTSELLNGLFFSPKLMASRLSLINPVYYAKLSAPARKEAMTTMATFIGTGLTILSLAKAAGADVEGDWRSPDFGKIKVGNTRYDIWGGFQQYARLAGQMITGETKSTTTGKISKLNSGKFGSRTRGDVAGDFLKGKFSPPASFAATMLEGETQTGEKASILPSKEYRGELAENITPMVLSDTYDAFKDAGIGQGLATGVSAFFGVGTQTYKQKYKVKKNKTKKRDSYIQKTNF